MSDFTDLRDRLDQLAELHVSDVEPVTVPAEMGRTPSVWPVRLAAAAVVAVLATAAWVLFDRAVDDESPADDGAEVVTLGEPELGLPGWAELPIVDIADLDPAVQEMLGSRDDIDLSTLRLVDTDGVERLVALSADHSYVWFLLRTEGGMTGTKGSLIGLLHDNLILSIGWATGEGAPMRRLGLVPERLTTVMAAEETFQLASGLFDVSHPHDINGPTVWVTTPDGVPIDLLDTKASEGSSITGDVMVEDEQIVIDIPAALCLETADGLRVNARRTTDGTFLAVNHGPSGTTVESFPVFDTDGISVRASAPASDMTIAVDKSDEVRVTLDSEELTGEIVVQCVNPPSLDQLVAAMRGE